MASKTAVLLSCLAAAAAAAPTYPPFTTSRNFYLVADVTECDLTPSIQDWAVNSYHIGAGYDYAVLSPPDTEYPRAFYLNGTAEEIRYGEGDVLTDGGTPSFPYGFIVPQANETDSEGRRQVEIIAGYGTKGVQLSQFPDPTPNLQYGNREVMETFGGWYACNTTYIYGSAIGLFYRSYHEEKPYGCAAVTLYPQCAGKASHVAKYAKKAECYKNVTAVAGSLS